MIRSYPVPKTAATDRWEYKCKDSSVKNFDVSKGVAELYGFSPGTKVKTPKGVGLVVGAEDNFLWFHLDTDSGASYWDQCTNAQGCQQLGVTLVEEDKPLPSLDSPGTYRLKRITYKSRHRTIVLQNTNGPCPLLGISNLLALQGHIRFPDKADRVTNEQLIAAISLHCEKLLCGLSPQQRREAETVLQTLGNLTSGLVVDFALDTCNKFQPTPYDLVLKLMGIRFVHGWVVDPQESVAKALAGRTYEGVQQLLLGTDSNERLAPEVASAVNHWLFNYSSQLTPFGLRALAQDVQEDELVVFFRNNHFTTLTKHKGQLFNLVTDLGYERERLVIWEVLDDTVQSTYADSEFQSQLESQKVEAFNTATLSGYSTTDIQKAWDTLVKRNGGANVDELLKLLAESTSLPDLV